ncbi:MAG: hypothetical protein QOI26_151, partial [Pseudonocardiales bacterium]|nr:hypothetical protein [Pseudonocardiales bacterium]
TKMAESFGWSKSDYKVTQLTTIDALSAALKSGTIQAFYWNPQQVAQLAEQGVGVNLGPGAQYVGQTINSAFTVTDSALKDKAAAVKVFLTGYYNLVKKLQADPTPVLNTLVNDEKANKAATESVYKASVAGWSATGDMPEANKQGLSAAVVFLTPKVKSVDIAKICIDWHTL